MPADPAAVNQVDRLLSEWPALELDEQAGRAIERMRAERRRAEEAVRLSTAEDAELELPGLGGELRPFQRAGVRYALAQRRTFIADEAFPAAVVCPASMKLVWEREARAWLPGPIVAVLHGRSPAGWGRSGAGSAALVVLNYKILESQLDRLGRGGAGAAREGAGRAARGGLSPTGAMSSSPS